MKKIFIWLLAFVLTISAAIYQRKTGPTYPKKAKINIKDTVYKISFIRSNNQQDAKIKLDLPKSFTGKVFFRQYPTANKMQKIDFVRKNGSLIAFLPVQPPAGKLEYFIKLNKNNKQIFNNEKNPVIIRFKGNVPDFVLVPHIIIMFIAMFFSNLSGFLAIFKYDTQRIYLFITYILLIIGGGILGPIVQKFAFGQYWTGVPFGWDLTDNKLLIALIFWTAAVIANFKKQRKYMTIIAAIVVLVIFSIPHSLLGSELDHKTGEIIQGNIFLLFATFYKLQKSKIKKCFLKKNES